MNLNHYSFEHDERSVQNIWQNTRNLMKVFEVNGKENRTNHDCQANVDDQKPKVYLVCNAPESLFVG